MLRDSSSSRGRPGGQRVASPSNRDDRGGIVMLRLRRPSPAMGVAMFALFVALGGASVAATNDFLPRNSVGTVQLRNDSVTRAKMAHQSITNLLIKPGSLM